MNPSGRQKMKRPARHLPWILLTAFLVLSMGPGGAFSAGDPPDSLAGPPGAPRGADQEIIVRLQPGAVRSAAAEQRIHREAGGTVRRQLGRVEGLQLVRIPADVPLEEALSRYSDRPDVLYAEPDYPVYALGGVSFSDLWGLHNTGQVIGGQAGTAGADIRALAAWEIEPGSRDVVVAVVDTGVDYTHPDLAGNMWQDAVGRYGKNFIAGMDPDDPMDDEGHGTHVAGTIAANGRQASAMRGVMQEARIMALKVLNSSGSGKTSDLIDAIAYAGENGARVINLSLSLSTGGAEPSQALRDVLSASPAVIVAAAGNASSNNDTKPTYPASYDLPHLVAVAASDNRDKLASFSNYGSHTVHLAAPGWAILSTKRGGGYTFMNGTSMAAPHVSGVAGLLLSRYPDRSHAQIAGYLQEGVEPVASLADLVASGGRLYARGALLAAGYGDELAIAESRTFLEDAQPFLPLEGVDENVVPMLQSLLEGHPPAQGVTVSLLSAAGHPGIDETGSILYAEEPSSGSVWVSLERGPMEGEPFALSFLVPGRGSGEYRIDAVVIEKEGEKLRMTPELYAQARDDGVFVFGPEGRLILPCCIQSSDGNYYGLEAYVHARAATDGTVAAALQLLFQSPSFVRELSPQTVIRDGEEYVILP